MSLIDRALNSPEYLRLKRARLFEAFDQYKSNVDYGIIDETALEHERIVKWYNECKDLNKNAINNPPKAIYDILVKMKKQYAKI